MLRHAMSNRRNGPIRHTVPSLLHRHGHTRHIIPRRHRHIHTQHPGGVLHRHGLPGDGHSGCFPLFAQAVIDPQSRKTAPQGGQDPHAVHDLHRLGMMPQIEQHDQRRKQPRDDKDSGHDIQDSSMHSFSVFPITDQFTYQKPSHTPRFVVIRPSTKAAIPQKEGGAPSAPPSGYRINPQDYSCMDLNSSLYLL